MKTSLPRSSLTAAALLAAAVLVSFGASLARATGNLWHDKFVTYETAKGHTKYMSTSTGTLGWQESYMLRSYVLVYELTKSTAWLDKFTTHVDYMIAQTTDTDGDGFLDWKTTAYGDGGNYPYLVFDGMICLPIAQFVLLVQQNPTTLAAYSTKAATYRAFIETEILPKWITSSSYPGNCWVQVNSTTGYFKEPVNFESLPDAVFNPLPYNMMAAYAQLLYVMYDVNGDASHKARAQHTVQYYKNGLTTNGTGYTWWYCNISNPHTEDTSHGNLEVGMAIDSYNRGTIIGGTVIDKLSKTYTDKMWNQNLTAPKVKDYVNGTGTTYADTLYVTGWTRLSQFNATNWFIGANQFRSIAPTNFNHAHTIAQLMAWDPVKIVNQGFEYVSATDATLPARWVRSGTTSTVALDSANKTAGNYGAKVQSLAGDGTWQKLYQYWAEWKPSTTYVVTYDCKASGVAGGRIHMYDESTSTSLGGVQNFDNTSWSSLSFTFTTPASTTGPIRLTLQNHDQSNAGTAWFDNVKIKQSGDAW